MDLKEYDDENLKMIVPLKEIMFEELKHLINFLKGNNHNESEEKRNENVFRRIGLFFPELNAVQEVKFFSIISAIIANESGVESAFLSFQKAFPDLKVYRDGSGRPVKKDYWTIRLDSLEQMFLSLSAKEKLSSSERQIIEAKTLANLEDVKCNTAYPITKNVFFRRTNNNEINIDIIKKIERMLSDMKISTEILNKFFTKYMGRNWNSIRTWFKHFESRLDILYIDFRNSNGLLKDKANKDFLETLKRVCA